MELRCPICGKTMRSPKRHMKRYHRVYFPNDDFAIAFVKLYRIFRSRGYRLPLKSPSSLEYEDYMEIFRVSARIFRSSRRALRYLEPYAQFFAYRFASRLLEEAEALLSTKNKTLRGLYFVVLTFIPSEEALGIVMEHCTPEKSAFLKYIYGIFSRYKDSILTEFKRIVDRKNLIVIPCTLKALFAVIPERFYEAFKYFLDRASREDIENLKELLWELYDYVMAFPKRYHERKEVKKAVRILAKLRLYNKIDAEIDAETLDRANKIFVALRILDDYWSRLYYGCQKQKFYQIQAEIKGRLKGDDLEAFISRIAGIAERYPTMCSKLSTIKTEEYLAVIEVIPSPYLKAYFLYIISDINLKHGQIATANEILTYLTESLVNWKYDFLPHAYLLLALVKEFMGDLNSAVAIHEKLLEISGKLWDKAKLDAARVYAKLGKKEKAKELLGTVPSLIYKVILESYIGMETNSTKLKRLVLVDNPDKALKILDATEKICYCMYDKAIEEAKSDPEILRAILDIQSISCSRHFKRFVFHAHKKLKENELINFFMGVLMLQQEKYSEALEYFSKAETPLIDPEILAINKLYAAIMAGNTIANSIAEKLKNYESYEAKLALLHYYMWKKDFDKAYKILITIRKEMEHEIYLELKRKIKQKTFTSDHYTYYITTRKNIDTTCPLLHIILNQ